MGKNDKKWVVAPLADLYGPSCMVTLVSIGIFLSLSKGSYFSDPYLEKHISNEEGGMDALAALG